MGNPRRGPRASQDSLTTTDSSIADTPANVDATSSSSSSSVRATSSLAGKDTDYQRPQGKGMRDPYDRRGSIHTFGSAPSPTSQRSAATLVPTRASTPQPEAEAETEAGAGGDSPARGASKPSHSRAPQGPRRIMAPPVDTLWDDGTPVSSSDGSPPSAPTMSSASAQQQQRQPERGGLEKKSSRGPCVSGADADFSSRAEAYKRVHNLKLELEHVVPSSALLRFQPSTKEELRESLDVASPDPGPVAAARGRTTYDPIEYMSPLPRAMVASGTRADRKTAEGRGTNTKDFNERISVMFPMSSALTGRASSPQMWPSISPRNAMPRTAFTPTLNHPPTRFSDVGSPHHRAEPAMASGMLQLRSGKPLEEAPPGSVVSAIRTRPEEVHPTVEEVERRQAEGKLPYPSRMTFGFPAADASGGSYSASMRSGSVALRDAEAGTGLSHRRQNLGSSRVGGGAGGDHSRHVVVSTARGPPVMRAVESEPTVVRPHGFPVRRALVERRQRQQARAEQEAAARARTHTALLRSHHVPIVPFTTTVNEHQMPLPAPTLEEAVMAFEFDANDYHNGDASGLIQAPRKLQRAMTREGVRPSSAAINAGSIGVGGFKRRPNSGAVFSGVTKYVFGRRAGGGPMGGGRSAFLKEADPAQCWAAQLSAQTHLHLDPLFPEDLMIDDPVDDYASGLTTTVHSPQQALTMSGFGGGWSSSSLRHSPQPAHAPSGGGRHLGI